MIESSNFRQINEIEREIIIQSLSKISPTIIQFIIRSKNMLYISLKKGNSETNYPSIYLASNYFQEEIDLIEFNDKIYSVGLYFGFIKRGRFYISLEGAENLYKNNIFSEFQHVQVNKTGEKSILYGNNILKNMIIKTPEHLRENDFLLVFNKRNEIIAIAQARVKIQNISLLKPNEVLAINLSDKGLYLRKQQ